jgi:hypothetical protein
MYGVDLLATTYCFDHKGATEAQSQRVRQYWYQARANEVVEHLEHLEALQVLFRSFLRRRAAMRRSSSAASSG